MRVKILKINVRGVILGLCKPLLLASLLGWASTAHAQQKEEGRLDPYSSIVNNIELWANILKELDLYYVDSLDANKVTQTGIDAMLNSLDPYTMYIPKEQEDNFRIMTTGEYAGIGAVISYKDSCVIINEPYEGLPAAKAGLKAGDVILSINNQDMRKSTVAQVSEKLRGQQGTAFDIEIQRFGESHPQVIRVVRENIHINSVPYYGVLDNNVGYIALSNFIEQSGKEVEYAFRELKKEGINALVLDLRDNGGGILEAAIDILGLFLPKESLVLSTQGRIKAWDQKYYTSTKPIDLQIPLVVLVNKNSASASEIVAGALQDLDRAVVMGERTFGKGLVQTTRSLPQGAMLKLTISKYYTPSGRCVQALDYSHRDSLGRVSRLPDSLTQVFYTHAGRPVKDGGGIAPDVLISEKQTPTILYYLMTDYVVFDFVTQWIHKHQPQIKSVSDLALSDDTYEEFKDFAESRKFSYDMVSQRTLNSLKEVMTLEGYMDDAQEAFDTLKSKLVPNLDRDLDRFRSDIERMITVEIARRYFYKKGEVEENLKWDTTVKHATELVTSARYSELLATPK